MDPQGNRTLLIDPDSVRTEYTYDELNRLEALTFGDGQAVTFEYFPDSLKQRVTNPNGTTSTYDYDAADRMDTITHVGVGWQWELKRQLARECRPMDGVICLTEVLLDERRDQ